MFSGLLFPFFLFFEQGVETFSHFASWERVQFVLKMPQSDDIGQLIGPTGIVVLIPFVHMNQSKDALLDHEIADGYPIDRCPVFVKAICDQTEYFRI